ncbi:M48 family metalloprotease [Humisphaera borealis]|uniref:M48 family metalloprotease n=1 Tax=Humisphaera borealis TaxID=2807512 RepID=A0A7M2X1L1_9BACT|nr:M48 family metalloprotease [Humisphaera borealis]QOV91583.1 M48 family metalloprotease [Humisphaera borealis]
MNKPTSLLARGSLLALLGVVASTPLNMGGCSVNNMNVGGLIQGGGQAIQGATLGEKDELAIGESAVCAITSQYPLSTDEKLNKYVNLVGLTVASACPRDDIQFCFGVLETNEVNAFSAPGGFVLITRGALRQMDDEAELAGVLAHEIGHVVLRHGFDVTKAAMQAEGLSTMAKSASPDQQLGAGADGLSKTLLSQGWAQPQEFSADDEAVHYIVRAGYDPASFERFLKRLDQSGGSLMSTHPGKHERLAKVSAMIDKLAARGKGQTLKPRFAENVAK